ncbi:hypothetical protein NKG94_01890 [Micromonospora sp. M12]
MVRLRGRGADRHADLPDDPRHRHTTAGARRPATVRLEPLSLDLIATGQRTAISGKSIRVTRVETFALLVPAQTVGTSVLGLNDTALTVTAG